MNWYTNYYYSFKYEIDKKNLFTKKYEEQKNASTSVFCSNEEIVKIDKHNSVKTVSDTTELLNNVKTSVKGYN